MAVDKKDDFADFTSQADEPTAMWSEEALKAEQAAGSAAPAASPASAPASASTSVPASAPAQARKARGERKIVRRALPSPAAPAAGAGGGVSWTLTIAVAIALGTGVYYLVRFISGL